MQRRLKHWGWGYEDEQPPLDELRGAARFLGERLGFGSVDPEQPVPLSEVSLPAARLRPPEALAPICSTDRPRARPARIRPFLHRRRACVPGPVRPSARRGRPPARRGRTAGHARLGAVRRRGRDPVRRRHQRGRRRRAGRLRATIAAVVTIDLKALDRVLEVDRVSLSARIQAGATGPVLEQQLGEHGLTLRHFPQSFRVLDARRLDRHPRRRPLRHPVHAHRRPRRVGASAHAGRILGVAARAGVGRRRLTRPDADRLGGNARADHRSLGPRPPAPDVAARRRRCGSAIS